MDPFEALMNLTARIRSGRLNRLMAGAADSSQPLPNATASTTRHPAMAGIDVPPVHGRHCICQRCTPETRRDAA
jgi:hypothetical protein